MGDHQPDLPLTRRHVIRRLVAGAVVLLGGRHTVVGALGARTARAVPTPSIITRAQWGARPPASPFRRHQPVRITLHHEGVVFDGSIPTPPYLRKVQRWSIEDRKWPDIPYHYLIDRAGLMYQGRPVTAVGDTSTAYNPTGHALIAVLGQYDQQQPVQRQLDALVALIAWLADSLHIPVTAIHGHRDYVATACPGTNLYRFLANGYLVDAVQRRLTAR